MNRVLTVISPGLLGAAVVLSACRGELAGATGQLATTSPNAVPATPISTPDEAAPSSTPTGISRLAAKECSPPAGLEPTAETRSLILVSVPDYPAWTGGLIDGLTGDTLPIPQDYVPIGWSPSLTRLALVDTEFHALFIATPTGQGIHLLWHPPAGFVGLNSRWLTDCTMLVLVFETLDDAYPSVFLLDVYTGRADSVQPSDQGYLVATSADGSFWVEYDSDLEVVWPDGTRRPFLQTGSAVVAGSFPYNQSIAFIPGADQVVYVACEEPSWPRSCHMYLAPVSEGRVLEGAPIYFLGGESGVASVRASPDARLLAFNNFGLGVFSILDLRTALVVSTLPWPEGRSQASLVWSPDSSSIATSYMGPHTAAITVWNFTTGDRRLLRESSNPANLIDWREVPLE